MGNCLSQPSGQSAAAAPERTAPPKTEELAPLTPPQAALESSAPSTGALSTPPAASRDPSSMEGSVSRGRDTPKDSPRSSAHGRPGPAVLTESTLERLNEGSALRKPTPSSTGGTTANTRAPDALDLGELPELPEAEEYVGPADAGGAPHYASPGMPAGTPPPAPEDLPVVSLQDIHVMEQKQGRRGWRVKSRRGSTSASHASLSAIPENVELTALHARSERSDSMRVGLPSAGVGKLADVAELEMDSKSATAGSRPSVLDSPRSSASSRSILNSGDDSLMPQHVEYEYEMFMPVLPRPRAYPRVPNATEAYRASVRRESFSNAWLSGVADIAVAAPATAGSPRSAMAMDVVMTDDSGLQLLHSCVQSAGASGRRELSAEDLRLQIPPGAPLSPLGQEDANCPEMEQGVAQQETLTFALPVAVEGLRCVKKYAVGELSWHQQIYMGDFAAGEHTFQFPETTVPVGKLTVGRYCMKTVFMDAHGQDLWAGMNEFKVVAKHDQR